MIGSKPVEMAPWPDDVKLDAGGMPEEGFLAIEARDLGRTLGLMQVLAMVSHETTREATISDTVAYVKQRLPMVIW